MPMPSKGVRVQTTIRLPADLHRAAVAQAKLKRLSVNEYLTRTVQDGIGVPVAPPVGERQNVGVYNDQGERIGTV